jgi:hypothetical protein
MPMPAVIPWSLPRLVSVTSDAGLDDRLAALEAQVAALREAREEPITARRAEEIRAIALHVLADTDARIATLEAATAGWDRKFFIASADGGFRLTIDGQVQARYVWGHKDHAPGVDGSDGGFEVRRARVEFAGHVGDETWRYRLRLAFGRSDGVANLEDAHIEKILGGGWAMRFGQFKAPFFREHNLSSKRQLAVERSLVSDEFSQGRTQGVEIAWVGERFGFSASYNDGFEAEDVDALDGDVEYAATGRVEFLAAGEWDRFEDFTSWRGDEVAILLGAGVHVQRDESGTVAGPEEERFTWTVDGAIEGDGGNLSAAFVARHLDAADVDQLGLVVQGGVFVMDGWEVFGRYEWGDLDTAGAADLSLATVGFNRYWRKHALKLTADVGYAFDEVAAPFAAGGAGWRADAPGADGQIVVRSQLQLLF